MSLEVRLKSLIATDGPIPVSTWMTVCLHDPQEGYYATQPGLGRDFVTAPETSQVFGELIGLWAASVWQNMGRPDPFNLVELGPGRAALMQDALRAARAVPGFVAAARLTLVEASPALRKIQAERLADHTPNFAESLSDVPAGPAIFIANEFLDCLPARQFVKDRGEWRERVVGLGPDGEFTFGLAVEEAPQDALAASHGETVEVQPGLPVLIDRLAEREAPFAALFIDYGPADDAPGDTLRAYREGEQVSPLSAPGSCDLTVDVDFGRLARLARAAGLGVTGPVTQRAFLASLGIEARMQALIAANPDDAEAIHTACLKLVDPGEMGERFKVIALASSR